MAEVVLYTTPFCPFCVRAKRLLDMKGVAYEDIDISGKPTLRREMTERSGGGMTVPQIFIDGAPIGGSDELMALEITGELDQRLGLSDD